MKVIGIKTGLSKQTVPFTVLATVADYSDYDKDVCKAQGQNVQEIYVRGKHFEPSLIGRQIKVIYDVGFGGKAVAVDIVEVK